MKAVSIFNREVDPFKQAGIAIFAQIVALAAIKASQSGTEGIPTVYWEAVFTVLLAYMLFNAMLSFPYKKRSQYFVRSLMAYAAIVFSGALLANWFSGITMDEAGSFRWLYLLLSFCYLVFLSIANAMWKIIEMAKKEDKRLRGED